MNAISFKNFRKFEEFPTLKLGGITYLVGGNNAGKSTVVKAMRLLLANLKSLQTIGTGMLNRKPVFYFDNPKNIHIGTFVKALRHGAERKAMTIEGELSPLNIGMDISLAENDAAYGMIDQIRLSNEKDGYALTLDITNSKTCLSKLEGNSSLFFNNDSGKESTERVSSLTKELNKLMKAISEGEENLQQINENIQKEKLELAKFDKAVMYSSDKGDKNFYDEDENFIGTEFEEMQRKNSIQLLEQQKDINKNQLQTLLIQASYIKNEIDILTKQQSDADNQSDSSLEDLQKRLHERNQYFADLRTKYKQLSVDFQEKKEELVAKKEEKENYEKKYSFKFEKDGETMWGCYGKEDSPITDADKTQQVKKYQNEIDPLKEQCRDIRIEQEDIEHQLINVPFELHDLQSRIEILKKVQNKRKPTKSSSQDSEEQIAIPLSMAINYEGENVICQYINGMIMTLSTDKRSANPAAVQLLKQIREQFEEVLRGNNIEYVPAHAATQQTIFRISDENDNMAQLVHAWSRQQINPGDEEHQFIIRWMKSLGIGENFKVRPMEGEAYAVDIYEHNSDTTPATLSELGMGAIQAMTLLFRLSSIMRQYKEQKNKPMILIEEPEQNMHPNWQSQLAEIFDEMHNKKGFTLVVETHSEYITRHTQLLIANEKYANEEDLVENNPYTIYYFSEKRGVVDMKFTLTGRFINSFDSGFYDMAANDALLLSKIEREKKTL